MGKGDVTARVGGMRVARVMDRGSIPRVGGAGVSGALFGLGSDGVGFAGVWGYISVKGMDFWNCVLGNGLVD